MALSENYVQEQMLRVERQKLAVEENKLKVLTDIRDVLLMLHAMYSLEIEARARKGKYQNADVEVVGKDISNIKGAMEKRWSK